MQAGDVALTSRALQAPERDRMLPYYAYRGGRDSRRLLPQTGVVLAWRPRRRRAARHRAVAVRRPARQPAPRAARRSSHRPLEHLVRRNLRNLTHCWVDVMEMSSTADEPAVAHRHRRPLPLHRRDRARQRCRRRVHALRLLGGRPRRLEQDGRTRWRCSPRCCARRNSSSESSGARRAQGVHIIPIDTQAMREGDVQVARRLGASSDARGLQGACARGGVVAMALDRDLIGNGEPLDFFGHAGADPDRVGRDRHPVRGRRGPDPVVPRTSIGSTRWSTRRSTMPRINQETPRCARLREILLRIFERAIRDHPEQWHVLDPIWPEPKRREDLPGLARTTSCIPGGVTEHVRHLVGRSCGRAATMSPCWRRRAGSATITASPATCASAAACRCETQRLGGADRAVAFTSCAACARCSTRTRSTSCTTTSRSCRRCRSPCCGFTAAPTSGRSTRWRGATSATTTAGRS